MVEMMEEGILFYFDELKVLLYACGYRQVEGILMPEREYSREELIRLLQNLTRKGIITADGEVFWVEERYRELLRTVGGPERTFLWRPFRKEVEGDDLPEFFCYARDKYVVVSERYWKRKDTVKLRGFSMEMFEKWKEQIQNDYSRH